MIFAQMLEIVALSDLASVLCARKFSFAQQGGLTPQKCPLSRRRETTALRACFFWVGSSLNLGFGLWVF